MFRVGVARTEREEVSARELREKYGGRTNEATNRAIRAEIDGGNDCLEALHRLHRLVKRYRVGSAHHTLVQQALDNIREIAESMTVEIRRRYSVGED